MNLMFERDARSVVAEVSKWARGDARPPKSANAPDDARLVQIVGRHLHFHAITSGQTNEAFAHFPGDRRQDLMLVVQLNFEHRSSQHGQNLTFNFDVFFHLLFQLSTNRTRIQAFAK